MFSWADLRRDWVDGAAWQQLIAAVKSKGPQYTAVSPAVMSHPLDGVPITSYLRALQLSAAEAETIEKWVRLEISRLVAGGAA